MEDRHPSAGWWAERLAALLALAGLVASSLGGYHVREWQDSASDFKTVYASGKCFLQGMRAYSFANIANVFHRYGVVLPWTWYAHAPTYPPFTFAALAPVISLPLVPAVYVWMALSALALVGAIWAMAGRSQRSFGLERVWRLLLIVFVASSPLVSFGLQIGNVSVAAAALCVAAVMLTDVVSPNWLALVLTYSLLLKPHVALCLMFGMFVSRNRRDRMLALRAASFFAVALVLFVLFSLHAPLGMQLHDYTAMVTNEINNGCLNPRNHELLPPVAEVTSLQLLFGYGMKPAGMNAATGVGLVVMAALLLYASRRKGNQGEDTRLELLGAWSTFGLLATYHRSHDGIILILLLPWLLTRWRRQLADPVVWGVLFFFTAMGLGGFPPTFDWIAHAGLPAVAQFLVFRQSALATLLLMLVLLAHLLWQSRHQREPRGVAS